MTSQPTRRDQELAEAWASLRAACERHDETCRRNAVRRERVMRAVARLNEIAAELRAQSAHR